MSKKECIQGFSDYIFWDVDRYSIDPAVNAPFIVQRVLEYGQYEDWKHLLAYYGLDSIVDTARRKSSFFYKHRFQNPYRTVPMLQYQTIYPATLQLLKDLQTLDLGNSWQSIW